MPKVFIHFCFFIIAALAKDLSDLDYRGFDRATCAQNVSKWLKTETNNASASGFFASTPSRNQTTMIELNKEGCDYFCGTSTVYHDWLPRLVVWTIPSLLLLSNIQLAPVSVKRFLAILHALGDPIDSFWSLVHKAYVWWCLWHVAHEEIDRARQRDACAAAGRDAAASTEVRVVATVLSGLEELSGAVILSEAPYRRVVRDYYRVEDRSMSDVDKVRRQKWNEAAAQLAIGRTIDPLQTFLSIAVYYFGITSALYDTLGGGGGTPPGGRIACAIFLSWLVPLALLSNTLGSCSSQVGCLRTMTSFLELADGEDITPAAANGDDDSAFVARTWETYFNSAVWMGAMHTFRPWKVTYRRKPRRSDRALKAIMATIAFLPPLVSMLGAFWIIYYAIPMGFTCRHVWVLLVYFLWCLSAILTSSLYLLMGNSSWYWGLTCLKDLLVAANTVGWPIASVIGVHNSCQCWSSAWPFGNGFIPVGVTEAYEERVAAVYRPIILSTQLFYVLFFGGIVLGFRHGFKIIWWRASHFERQWADDHPYQAWPPLFVRYLRLALGGLTHQVTLLNSADGDGQDIAAGHQPGIESIPLGSIATTS